MTLLNWQDPPFNRWSFQHLRELIPTPADSGRSRSGPATGAPLPRARSRAVTVNRVDDRCRAWPTCSRRPGPTLLWSSTTAGWCWSATTAGWPRDGASADVGHQVGGRVCRRGAGRPRTAGPRSPGRPLRAGGHRCGIRRARVRDLLDMRTGCSSARSTPTRVRGPGDGAAHGMAARAESRTPSAACTTSSRR